MALKLLAPNNALLNIQGLEVAFFLRKGVTRAINHLNITLRKGETLGLVGESGSGKSVTSLTIMRLITDPGRILDGRVWFDGKDLLKLNNKQMRQIRGNRIAIIFQYPMIGLNPVLTIGKQLTETLILHKKLNKKEALENAEFLLDEVGLTNPRIQLRRYPHELSGGMRQRVMISMALSWEPDLLIADEPTTALDVTIQAQILELMKELQEKYQAANLMITHDIGVIAEVADRVAVMHAGDVVEEAEIGQLFNDPKHPYTLGLMKAIPSAVESLVDNESFYNIPGAVPSSLKLPEG